MKLTGLHYIAGQPSASGSRTFTATDPATATALPTAFHEATDQEVDAAVQAAAAAEYHRATAAQRAALLDTIATQLLDLGETLVERCRAETGLPAGRIQGERGRTVNQLRLFSAVLREGSWVDARIDRADPDREPTPQPDIRSMLQPLGPVGVFGAGNFPLAFSVAGGDTASALAGGCPVIVKGHPSHPGTSELVGRAIVAAVAACGLPAGTFSLLQGQGHEVGQALVRHPLLAAVGFTGSYRGGKALFDAANQRPRPIPVYAEMGSTNPVFILPEALRERGAAIAEGLTQSVTLGVGQFCTNPGLVFLAPEAAAAGTFRDAVARQFAAVEADTMLNDGIAVAYAAGVERLQSELTLLAKGRERDTGYAGTAYVFHAPARRFLENERLEEEVFGPATITLTAETREELLDGARRLGGHLTATVFGTEADLRDHADLLAILAQKAGRVIVNNFPTGVEVGHAMVHGGPFPATTDSRSTSVGTRAIARFARPVCYQNFPDWLLPAALQEANPLGIRRLVDGTWTG